MISFQKEPGAGKSDLRPENGTKWVFCGEFVPIAHPFLPRFTHIAPPLILRYTTEIECQQECIYYNVVWTFCTDCHYSVEIHHAEACEVLWWCGTSLAWFESSWLPWQGGRWSRRRLTRRTRRRLRGLLSLTQLQAEYGNCQQQKEAGKTSWNAPSSTPSLRSWLDLVFKIDLLHGFSIKLDPEHDSGWFFSIYFFLKVDIS